VKELFHGLDAPSPFQHVTWNIATCRRSTQHPAPDKENAVLVARQNVDMRDDDPDYPALALANYISAARPASIRA
jgi:zinc protease